MPEQRPTKKQLELLNFIDGFIKGNGYGPSYREIMRALDYKSVSTVAIHIDNLITRGHLIKTKNSARSLEVVSESLSQPPAKKPNNHIEWLKNEIKTREQNPELASELEILKAALGILSQETD